MHLSAQRGFRCDLCLCAIYDPLPIAVGIGFGIGSPKRHAWATLGPRLGHPWATLGSNEESTLFATKDGKGRVGYRNRRDRSTSHVIGRTKPHGRGRVRSTSIPQAGARALQAAAENINHKGHGRNTKTAEYTSKRYSIMGRLKSQKRRKIFATWSDFI